MRPLIVTLLVGLGACTPSSERTAPEAAASSSSPAPSISAPQAEPSPAKTFRTEPTPGEIVYYLTHPQPEMVDRYCGAHDRSYIVGHVKVPPGQRDVLTRALHALFQEGFNADRSIASVSVQGERATLNLKTTDEIGWASASCGGVAFQGSVLRTIFQFDHIEEAQILLRGSCKDFGEFSQAGVCITFTRSDL